MCRSVVAVSLPEMVAVPFQAFIAKVGRHAQKARRRGWGGAPQAASGKDWMQWASSSGGAARHGAVGELGLFNFPTSAGWL